MQFERFDWLNGHGIWANYTMPEKYRPLNCLLIVLAKRNPQNVQNSSWTMNCRWVVSLPKLWAELALFSLESMHITFDAIFVVCTLIDKIATSQSARGNLDSYYNWKCTFSICLPKRSHNAPLVPVSPNFLEWILPANKNHSSPFKS